MAIWLKQSTAADVVLGPFVDDTDGKTPETALTISQSDCQLSKNGGAVAQKNDATSASHLGGGHYKVPLNTTDTNTLGRLRLYVNEGGALPAWMDFMVVPANVWDSFFGADALQVHANEITAGLITATALADNAITAAKIAADAITAAKIAADAITAAKIATGAIDADALAADAVAEIADGVWDEALAGHATAGTAGKALSDAAAAAAPSASAIADAVWDEALSGHLTAGSAGKALSDAQDGDYVAGSAAAALNAKRGYEGIIYGAAVTGTLSATQATTDLSGYANDALIGRTLTVTTGSRIGQQTTITDYASSGGLLTFAALTGALANGDLFFIA